MNDCFPPVGLEQLLQLLHTYGAGAGAVSLSVGVSPELKSPKAHEMVFGRDVLVQVIRSTCTGFPVPTTPPSCS